MWKSDLIDGDIIRQIGIRIALCHFPRLQPE
jgi:hypothetical protein